LGKDTGLGLAIVYGVVKQHHGWIGLQSAPQVGSTFKIFLPANTAVVCPGKAALSKRPRNSKETILVVEDEQSVGQLVRDILVEKGYRVLEAANGLEALQCWNEEGGDVDLLLTDMRMPKEMSGHELAQNLRALKPELKVIYTTGYSPEVGGCELDLVEGSNFLPKPYPPSKLVKIVRDCLNSTEVSVVPNWLERIQWGLVYRPGTLL
jgi:CheY-like chemotaxis protein